MEIVFQRRKDQSHRDINQPERSKLVTELTLEQNPSRENQRLSLSGHNNQQWPKVRSPCEVCCRQGKKKAQDPEMHAGENWGQSFRLPKISLCDIHQECYILCCPRLVPWIANKWKDKIDTIQNKWLRVVTRMATGSPIDFRQVEVNIVPLRDRIQKTCTITWEKYTRLEDSDKRKELILKKDRIRLKTRRGWRHASKPLVSQQINRDISKTIINRCLRGILL